MGYCCRRLSWTNSFALDDAFGHRSDDMARVRKSATIKRVNCLWAVLLAGRVAKGEVVSKLKKSRVMMSKEPTGSDRSTYRENP